MTPERLQQIVKDIRNSLVQMQIRKTLVDEVPQLLELDELVSELAILREKAALWDTIADVVMRLQERAEKAEAERDEWKRMVVEPREVKPIGWMSEAELLYAAAKHEVLRPPCEAALKDGG